MADTVTGKAFEATYGRIYARDPDDPELLTDGLYAAGSCDYVDDVVIKCVEQMSDYGYNVTFAEGDFVSTTAAHAIVRPNAYSDLEYWANEAITNFTYKDEYLVATQRSTPLIFKTRYTGSDGFSSQYSLNPTSNSLGVNTTAVKGGSLFVWWDSTENAIMCSTSSAKTNATRLFPNTTSTSLSTEPLSFFIMACGAGGEGESGKWTTTSGNTAQYNSCVGGHGGDGATTGIFLISPYELYKYYEANKSSITLPSTAADGLLIRFYAANSPAASGQAAISVGYKKSTSTEWVALYTYTCYQGGSWTTPTQATSLFTYAYDHDETRGIVGAAYSDTYATFETFIQKAGEVPGGEGGIGAMANFVGSTIVSHIGETGNPVDIASATAGEFLMSLPYESVTYGGYGGAYNDALTDILATTVT